MRLPIIHISRRTISPVQNRGVLYNHHLRSRSFSTSRRTDLAKRLVAAARWSGGIPNRSSSGWSARCRSPRALPAAARSLAASCRTSSSSGVGGPGDLRRSNHPVLPRSVRIATPSQVRWSQSAACGSTDNTSDHKISRTYRSTERRGGRSRPAVAISLSSEAVMDSGRLRKASFSRS